MKQSLKLLMTRESKEVLGKRGYNLCLLTLVLIAMFTSISFSEGSMLYLREKMEDPFTNWVSITKAVDNERFNSFRDALNEPQNMIKYNYSGVQMDQYTNYNIMGIDESHIRYLEARFFEHINTPLVQAILSETNIVEGCKVDNTILFDKTLGFIITLDAAKRLGYSEELLPTFINYLAANENADSLGIKLVMDDFFPVPIPVLAIVKRLPNNVDMISANFFYEQQHYNDHSHPFDFKSHEEYLQSLLYFVDDQLGIEKFKEEIFPLVPDSLKSTFKLLEDTMDSKSMKPWKSGKMLVIDLGEQHLSRNVYQDIADKIEAKYENNYVRRVYRLETEEHPSQRSSYLSIEFNSLSKIREFELFAKENGIQLEMAQVASKENFNSVTVMARILSAAMIVFSIVCIILFLVNMLQSYFQKVKHNLGTFKAFGMNALELIQVYAIILILIVISSVALALFITWTLQLLLPIIGIEKEGFNYLCLSNPTTYFAAIVVVISTFATVFIIMAKMLSQTPGDLIYDRNL
ncbi:MAG: hypothetical protein HUJ68_12220 [Clostridia bacterium]|nr:hypothetical protein [Clostridia bacterium]